MKTIVLVGAADTGRAPIAAALLRRLLGKEMAAVAVESAGVLGHDGDPAEPEARDTMLHLGLDISDHSARSLDDALAERADLLIAIDSGTARVVRGRYPAAAARIATLGGLANRKRDVPDPFRMQIGAWLTYARELDDMLQAALPAIRARLGQAVAPAAAAPASSTGTERNAAAGRVVQLLQLAAQMPDVLDWAAARGRLEQDLAAIAGAPTGPADLVAAYVAILRAAFAMIPAPSARQFAALHGAAARLAAPVDQAALNELSGLLPALPALA